MVSKKWELHGYYFDGKKSWVMYIDEYGNIKTRRWYEQQTQKRSKEEI